MSFTSMQASSAELGHGFRIVEDATQRDSIAFENGSTVNIFNVKTANRAATDHLAIDLQPIPSGFGCSDTINMITEQKIEDLPPCLKNSGKGVLLVGDPRDYTLNEIYTLSNFSQFVPEGKFIVIVKSVSSENADVQCWSTRISGKTANHIFEGYNVDSLVEQLRNELT